MIPHYIVVGAVVFLAACSAGSGAEVPPVASSTQSQAAAEAVVDVTLDSFTVGADVVTFVPTGWDVSADGTAAPPAGSQFGGDARWRIDDQCPGPCGSRDAATWEKVIAEAEFDQLLGDPSLTVVRNDVGSNRRTLEVLDADGHATIVAGRWVDGASAYLRCTLTGDAALLSDLAAALDFACENTRAELQGR